MQTQFPPFTASATTPATSASSSSAAVPPTAPSTFAPLHPLPPVVTARRPYDPYELTSADNPGNVITSVKFKGSNYDEWSRAIRGSLKARRKFGFVDGSITKPINDPDRLEEWEAIQSLLATWIYNTIDDDTRNSISYVENSKHMWDEIKQQFSVANGPKVHQLKRDLANCKQEGMPIVKYFGLLKKLWDELRDYENSPVCPNCSVCECGIVNFLTRKRDTEMLHQFLMGLDDVSFKNIRSTILNRDPLPSLNQAYQMVTQEETMLLISNSPAVRTDSMAFTVSSSSSLLPDSSKSQGERFNGDRRAQSSSLECTHCKKPGHDASTCFQLIGYPDWWERGLYPKSSGRGRGQYGRGQPSRGRGRGVRANAVVSSETFSSSQTEPPAGFTSAQWQAVIGLLGAQAPSSERLQGPNFADADWSG